MSSCTLGFCVHLQNSNRGEMAGGGVTLILVHVKLIPKLTTILILVSYIELI